VKINSLNEDTSSSVLVCISSPHNAPKLLKRGIKLSKILGASLYVLSIESSHDSFSEETKHSMPLLETLANEHRAEFISIKNSYKKASDTIIEVAKQKNITHVVLGQPCRTRWDMLTKGSIINEIIAELTEVDLYIVSVAKVQQPVESEYEQGISGSLIPTSNGYKLELRNEKSTETLDGIFYKSAFTDFNTGIFKTVYEKEVITVKVLNSFVDDLTDITDETHE
jgi:two-component system, OmpR family, sensor histidine kinase KdpD